MYEQIKLKADTVPNPNLLKGPQVWLSFHMQELLIASEIATDLCLVFRSGKSLPLPTMEWV